MEDVIFLNNSNNLIELKECQYHSEDKLQEYIEKNPALLAGWQITPDDPRKWILISREMGIPGTEDGGALWYLDHLFLDQDGIPTLVEVKRSTDTRIRREVVGQMLDYAANASAFWKIEDIQDLYQGNLCDDFGFDDEKTDDYWTMVDSNLKTGKMRLIFAADQIPETLQRMIEFLNNQMQNTEVLGLEIKQYLSENGNQILVPKIIGRTLQSVDTKRNRKSKVWDYDSFLEDVLRTGGTEAKKLAEKLIHDFSALGCRIWYGKGVTHSSIVIVYDAKNGKKMQLFYIYPWLKGVYSQLCFQYYKSPYDTDEKRLELKGKFEDILSIIIPVEKIHGQPSFPFEKLQDESVYQRFVALLQEMILEFDKANR